MKLEWMGAHRAAVEALIRCGNSYSQNVNLRGMMTEAVDISAAELQVMEYILENEERRENMSQVAARLDISQSSFSKIVAQLCRLGLLEKYRTCRNRKNDELDRMGPDAEAGFIRLLDTFSASMHAAREALSQRESEDIELIPLE